MSVEATAYVQAAMGIYLMMFSIFMFYNYYQSTLETPFSPKALGAGAEDAMDKATSNSPESNASSPPISEQFQTKERAPSSISLRSTPMHILTPLPPPSPVVLYLYGGMTLFALCSSFVIGFLLNNAFMFISADTLSDSYCSTVMTMNLFFFYLHSLTLFLVISFSVQHLLSVSNLNGTVYPLNSGYLMVYRLIVGVVHLYLPIHIAVFYHIEESVSTQTQWTNSDNSFVLCTLDDPGHSSYAPMIYVVLGLQIVMLLLTVIPLLSKYKVVRSDHRDPNKGDINDHHMNIIKYALFYLLISSIFDIIGVISLFEKPEVVGFAVIVMLTIRTSAIYVLSTETVSHKVLYRVPLNAFLWIWECVSPVDDVLELDPHYRWYYKDPEPADSTKGGSIHHSRSMHSMVSFERKPTNRIMHISGPTASHSLVPSKSKTNGAGAADPVGPKMTMTSTESNSQDPEVETLRTQTGDMIKQWERDVNGHKASTAGSGTSYLKNDSDIDRSSGDDITEFANSLGTSMPNSAPNNERWLSTKL